MKLKLVVMTLVVTILLLNWNYTFADDTMNDNTQTNIEHNSENTKENESGLVEDNIENKEDEKDQEVSSNLADILPGDDNATNPSSYKIKIDDENFPDEYFQIYLRRYDDNKDNALDQYEIDKIVDINNIIDISSIDSDKEIPKEINLSGIGKLRNLKRLEVSELTITGGIKELENLAKFEDLVLEYVDLDSPLKELNLPNIKIVRIDGETHKIEDIKHFKNLEELVIIKIYDKNLDELLKNLSIFPKLKKLYIEDAFNLETLDITDNNETLTEIYLKKTALKDLNGLEKYQNLEKIDIASGTITDLSNIFKIKGEKLNTIGVYGQYIQSSRKYKLNEPYKTEEIKLWDNAPVYIDPESEDHKGKTIWKENGIKDYTVNAHEKVNGIDISYNAQVYGIYEDSMIENEWNKIEIGTFTENFQKDGVLAKVIRNINISEDSHFANKFIIDGKDYTYSYYFGDDMTSRRFFNFDDNSVFQEYSGKDIYLKKDGLSYKIKTVADYQIGEETTVRKEEISYIKDGGIVHEVTYTNISDKDIKDMTISQSLDTMLNRDDYVPIYADGKGNAYITSNDFTLFLEKIGDKGKIIVAPYKQGIRQGKNADDYERGDVLLENDDTAIYYTTDILDLKPNESYTHTFKETLYTEPALIKAEDKVISLGDKWNPFDQLIGVYKESGAKLDKSKVEVSHNVDLNTPGVYDVTFTYNNVFSKVVSLTILDRKVSLVDINKMIKAPRNDIVDEEIQEPNINTKEDDKVATEIVNSNNDTRASKTPETSDNSGIDVYVLFGTVALGCILRFRNKNAK